MNNDNNKSDLGGFRKPLFILGALLVCLGGIVLLYLGLVVFNVINNPEQVRIVELVLSYVKVDEVIASFTYGDKKADVTISESARLIIFLFFGIVLLSILAGILRVLISGGISIIKLASGDKADESQ